MPVSFNQLLSSPVIARDGRAGSLTDVLFDDQHWRVRWLVIETGPWLFGRETLLSPSAVIAFDDESSRLHVDLTRQAIETGPGIGTDPPLHRQLENAGVTTLESVACGAERAVVSSWPLRLAGLSGWRAAPAPVVDDQAGDAHLRSAEEIGGYDVAASDKRLGSLDDLVLSDCLGRVQTAVIRTGRWWWRGDLQINPRLIRSIDWSGRRIALSRSRGGAPSTNGARGQSRAWPTGLHWERGSPSI